MTINITDILAGRVAAGASFDPFFGMNIDFGSIPVYANIIRHCSWWCPVGNPYAASNVPVDGWNCPTTDFSLYVPLIETVTGPTGDTYPIRFVGQATIGVQAGDTITQVAYDPAANVTTAILTVPAGADVVLLSFANTRRLATDATATGLDARTLTIMRPIAPGSSTHHDPSEKWNRQLRVALAPWRGPKRYGRFLDTNLINNVPDLPVQDVTNRTMPYSPIQAILAPTRGASLEDIYEFCNFLGMGCWLNFPDTGTDALFQLWLDIAKFGSDATGTPYTGATGANPWPDGLPANAENAPLAGGLYWEECNENWNGGGDGFVQNARYGQKALADYAALDANGILTTPTTLDATFSQVAYDLIRHADLARATFPGGLNTRYFPILSSQSGNTSESSTGVAYIDRYVAARGETAAQNIAAAGGDGYEGLAINVGDSSQTVASVLAGGRAGSAGIAQDGVAAVNFGLAGSSYECGLAEPDNPLGLLVDHAPGFRPLVAEQALNMVLCGIKFITTYTFIRGDHWNILDSLWTLTHPKYLGWCDVLACFPDDGSAAPGFPAPASPFLADPSFEQVRIDTNPSGFVYQAGGGPWTFAQSAGINGPSTGFVNPGQPVPTGTQVGFLQGTSSMTQTVPNWAAGAYTIGGRMNARLSNGGPLSFDVLVGGSVVGTFTPTGTVTSSRFATSPFTVAAGTHDVSLRTTAGSGDAVFLDDLVLAPAATPPATPTPQGVTLSPANPIVGGGTTQRFTATAHYPDGTAAVVAADSWSTNAPGGLLTAPAATTTAQSGTVTATIAGISGSTTYTIPAAPQPPPIPVIPVVAAVGPRVLFERLRLLG